MANEKINVTSPKGTMMYVVIDGEGKENFDGDGMIYEAKIDVPIKDAEPFMDKIDDFMESNAPRGYKEDSVPYKTHKDDDDVPKGHVRFAFKTNVLLPSGSKTKIRVYDSNKVETSLPDDVKIGNGSTGYVSGILRMYDRPKSKEYGASLFLKNVLILDLVEYKPDSGFDDVDTDDGSFQSFNSTKEFDDEDEAPRKKRRSASEDDEDEAPRKKRRSASEDDEDEEEDEETPRRRRRRG